jgi:glucose-6-phosphate isomerase
VKFYRQSLDGCFESDIGIEGLSKPGFDVALTNTRGGVEWIRDAYHARQWPLLQLPEERGDIDSLQSIAEVIKGQSKTILILGMGGSSLGGQTLQGLAAIDERSEPHIVFMENLDGHTFAQRLKGLDLETTSIIAISKSGRTAETAMQVFAFVAAYKTAGLQDLIAGQFIFITSPGDNPMRDLASELNIPILDHDPDLGGRYSVLSSVGLLPAILMGLDATALRTGAQSVLLDLLENDDCEPARGAAILSSMAEANGRRTSVFMPYADRLARLGPWYVQLSAESLGKDGKGMTPISARGPRDQHSALQLFLSGPNDKIFTILAHKRPHDGPQIFGDLVAEEFPYLSGKTMGQLVAAETYALVNTLRNHRRPARVFEVDVVDEMTMGALMMHFMLETIILGNVLGVNPFDQPAVEEGKKLAIKYLQDQ